MKHIDYPPTSGTEDENLKNVAVEKIEDITPLESIDTSIDYRIKDTKERLHEEGGYKLSDTGKEKIAEIERMNEIRREIGSTNTTARDQIKTVVQKRPLGDESYSGSSQIHHAQHTGSRVRNFATALLVGFTGLFSKQAKADTAENTFNDSTHTTKEIKMKTPNDSLSKKNTVPIYTQSRTIEGGITPTGMSNSFYENEFGITEADIGFLAKKYGFGTSSALEFQTGMVNLLAERNPEVLDGVLKKFGETNKGAGIEGLKDDMFGARSAFLMHFLKDGSAELMIDGKKVTYSGSTVHLEGGPEHHGGDIFETDGFKKLIVMFDNSGSMFRSRETLGNTLASNTSDVPVDVLAFNETVNAQMAFHSPAEASEYLKKIPISDMTEKGERAVDVLEKQLQSMDVQSGKTKIVVCTDEALQQVSHEKLATLQKLSQEKNVSLVFSVLINEKQYKLTLEDVENSFEKLIDGFTHQVQVRQNIISEAQKSLETAKGKEKKRLETEIKDAQHEMQYFQDFIDGKKLIDLSDFEKSSSNPSLVSR